MKDIKIFLIVLPMLLFVGCSHSIKMIETPPHADGFSPSSIPVEQKMPLILAYYQLINDGMESTMDDNHVEYMLNKLRESGLFSEVVRNASIQDFDKYIVLNFKSEERLDNHIFSNFLKYLLNYTIYITAPFLHSISDYEDKYTLDFERWDGEKRQFSAKANARLKQDAFATKGAKELGNKVRLSIYHSLINQMQSDLDFFVIERP